ncbi:hypothetical protein QWY86_15410 [Pedobacter aquatilis]|uniref:hypothetical protein n=1 Tax=Pedobacter aquatilis TaxID=351343 RepID=UPI0025B2AEED|nr:hypothetical protein [Pedobacter aquatilis]MDN3588070.1 hypothetical protein [Pedobacter aquatilis]
MSEFEYYINEIIKLKVEVLISFAAFVVSFFALVTTTYQLVIQRQHNRKSVRPIGQLKCLDRQETLYVYLTNDGMGPLTATKLIFRKDSLEYFNIEDCLNLDPKTYFHALIDSENQRTILPDAHIKIFEVLYQETDEEDKQILRKELYNMVVEAHYKDIYGKKFKVSRDLTFFSRHFGAEDYL